MKVEKIKRINESVEVNRNSNPLEDLRSNILTFPSQDYVYIEYKDGKLYAGGAANAGLFHDYEIDYDWDISVDANIQNLYDKIIKEHPEYEEEAEEIITENLKRYTVSEALEDYDGYVDMFADENINEKFDVEDVKYDDLTQKENDLYLFIDNNEEVYKKSLLPNLLNLAKWVGRGKFDANLAIKAFKNVIRDALPKYKKENNIADTFSDEEKTRIAKVLFTRYKEDIEGLDEIDNFQKIVNEDMKNYQRISKETWKKLKENNLTVVKDVHGDYEVIQ